MDRIDKYLSSTQESQNKPVKTKKTINKKIIENKTQDNIEISTKSTTKKKVFTTPETNMVVSYGAPNKNKAK